MSSARWRAGALTPYAALGRARARCAPARRPSDHRRARGQPCPPAGRDACARSAWIRGPPVSTRSLRRSSPSREDIDGFCGAARRLADLHRARCAAHGRVPQQALDRGLAAAKESDAVTHRLLTQLYSEEKVSAAWYRHTLTASNRADARTAPSCPSSTPARSIGAPPAPRPPAGELAACGAVAPQPGACCWKEEN